MFCQQTYPPPCFTECFLRTISSIPFIFSQSAAVQLPTTKPLCAAGADGVVPDDNKFVDCAIGAGADYIVSEDAHFRALETTPFPKVNVIRLNRFMEELAGPRQGQ